MFRRKTLLGVLVAHLFILANLAPAIAVAAKDKKKKTPQGTPVLWRRPADINSRNLLHGPGGPKPDLRRVTFVKEQTGGYSKKYRVRDSAGREWVAKIGKEAQAETVAVRLLWAVGYPTEINYLEPVTQIVGKGTFENVRFEARPKHIDRLDEWKWSENPFVGSKPLQGLKVMMALLNNWDIKDSNNQIFHVTSNRGSELQYVISDLGATFGQSGSTPILWRITRSRNSPEKYADAKFIDTVEDNHVYFHFGSKRHSLFNDITVEDALWIGNLLAQLSTEQLRDAFRAANYSPSEVGLLTNEVRGRIRELTSLRSHRQVGRTR